MLSGVPLGTDTNTMYIHENKYLILIEDILCGLFLWHTMCARCNVIFNSTIYKFTQLCHLAQLNMIHANIARKYHIFIYFDKYIEKKKELLSYKFTSTLCKNNVFLDKRIVFPLLEIQTCYILRQVPAWNISLYLELLINTIF